MTGQQYVAEEVKKVLKGINQDIFKYSMEKPLPAVWVEQNMILPDNASRYPGRFSYDLTPFWREPINHLHETSPVRYISIMKSVQCGCTAGVVIPGMLYIIAVDPNNTLFTASDLEIAKKTIEERLDTILRSSGLEHFIRPHAVKKGNQRSGDTAASKEFPGGTLTAFGTASANKFRYYSAKTSFVDDFETAPRDVQGEGSVRSLIEGRQNSFGSDAQTFFISTPKTTSTSNINDQYLLGTQKKWHWTCWNCNVLMVMDWRIKVDDDNYAGIVYTLDGKNRLVKDSVAFCCPHCGKLTQEKDKHALNKDGIWVSTVAEPAEEYHESYSMNAIIQPSGFTGWEKLAGMWLTANPPGKKPNVVLLKSFNNLQLGLPFEDYGQAPKSTALMSNIRHYAPGIIPDQTCFDDGNGKIVLVSLAFDLGGRHNETVEDVRLDWEIVAHAQNGVTYSVDQGSIGTFKRAHEISKFDKVDPDRKKWTYTNNSKVQNAAGEMENNSVWPLVEKLIQQRYKNESGQYWDIDITLIDTGFFEKHASSFVIRMQDKGLKVYGVKGRTDINYRPIQRDSQPVKRSAEKPSQLYIVEVNQLKDDLAANMSLQLGDGGEQPYGFMNFPQQQDGKYTYLNFFKHFEGEVRKDVKNGSDTIVGYRWEKKNSGVPNHFWDVRVYNLVSTYVWLDLFRRSDPKYKNYSWEEYVIMITE